MSKLDWNYKEVKQGATEEGFVNLTEGPHIVKILNVEDVEDKQYLKVQFDIADGPLKDYFKDMYARDTRDDKKWPNQATLYRSYKDSAKYFFAGFITAVEKSNDGFEFNPNANWASQFKGKLFVANFGKQEYISDDVDDTSKLIVKHTLKVQETRSISALKEDKIKVPELTKLSENDFNYKGVGVEDITRNAVEKKEDTEEYNKPDAEIPF